MRMKYRRCAHIIGVLLAKVVRSCPTRIAGIISAGDVPYASLAHPAAQNDAFLTLLL